MTLIDMANGSTVTTRSMAQNILQSILWELKHWNGCSSCSNYNKDATVNQLEHRAARLAKPLMSPCNGTKRVLPRDPDDTRGGG